MIMPVYKDKNSNTYYVKHRINGKSTTKRGFKSKHDAKTYEMKINLESVGGGNVYFVTVAKEFEEYLKNNALYGTYTKYKRFIDEFIIPNSPNKYISSFTDRDCLLFREYVNKLQYSTEYKNNMLGTYKQIFKYAKKFYQLQNLPTENIERFKKTSNEKMKLKTKELNIWNDEEFSKFIKCVNNRMYKSLFIVLYYTGMRRGECLALKWTDYKNGMFSISKSMTRKTIKGQYELKEPKNVSSIRDISLNKSLIEYMDSYKSEEMKISGFSEDWFIFGRKIPVAENTITRVKDRAIKQAGVKRITTHDLRHSHASNLIANGINIVAVSKRLGHSSIEMTLQKYTHLVDRNNKELTDNIEKCSQNVLKENKNADKIDV